MRTMRRRGSGQAMTIGIVAAGALVGAVLARQRWGGSPIGGGPRRALPGPGAVVRGMRPAFGRDAAAEASDEDARPARPAGPSSVRDRPEGWDPLDESFPASDPPATY